MKLQEKILEKGLTNKMLAEKIGSDAPMVSRYTNYKCLPTPETMKAICEALNCMVEDIYREEEISFNGCKRKKGNADLKNYKITVRLPKEAKEKIHYALKVCGYKNISYWLYRCYERLLVQSEIIEKARKKALRTTEKPLKRKCYTLKDNKSILTNKKELVKGVEYGNY